MSPQYSELLMSGYRRAIEEATTELGASAPTVRLAPAWFREPAFLESVAERIRAAHGFRAWGCGQYYGLP